MRYLALIAGLTGALALAAGCGSKAPPPVIASGGSGSKPVPTKGGSHAGAGKPATPEGGDTTGVGGAGNVMAEGLTVAISSPTATSDPNQDEVIVGDKVTVVCSVTAAAVAVHVDPATVTLEVLDADGKPANGMDSKPLSLPGVPTGNQDEYSAAFSTASIPTGVVSFRCSADSLEKDGSGTQTISTFVDHGPTITAQLPQKDSAHPLEGDLAVEFTVTPTPLTDNDDGAEVTAVSLHVAGVEIKDIVQDAKDPTTYRASINFTDGELFKEPPKEHTSVHVEATNARTPIAATAVDDYPFIVDGKGPAIAYTKPADNAAVYGETVIGFTAGDTGAGLDVDTLEIAISGYPGSPIKFDAKDSTVWSRAADDFTFRFDTGVLTGIESQIKVSIRAEDAAGNLTDGVTLLIYKDALPPAIDLDPSNVRGRDASKDCSLSFDPLFAALDDGVTTTVRNNLFRALIYDQTNKGSGQTVFYMSGTDKKTARLYIQPDTTQPFLIDTDKDGVCDSLAREDFKYVSLNPVVKNGGLQYSKTDFATEPAVVPGGGVCGLRDPVTQPLPLCMEASDMYVVTQHDIATKGDEPVVYAPGALLGFECTGSKIDLHDFTVQPNTNISLSPDGWICLAGRASDLLTNQGISRPLRICYDDPDVPGVPSCVGSNAAPPSCTTDCSAPPRFAPHIFRY
jgi:hypothetical protein